MAEVLIRRAGDSEWKTPSARSVTNEAELRDLLADSPKLLPGPDDIPLVAVTEFAVSTGYVDIVAVGSDGSIMIVECKLRANPEIRRQVLGQVLSYAGAIWGMRFEDFDDAFTRRSGTALLNLGDVFDDPQWNPDDFRRAVSHNLQTGQFRVVVAVDEITHELKQSISFLNSHTSDSVEMLAFEVAYAKDHDVEMLIPEVYGEEVAQKKRAARTRQWTEEDFWEHAAATSVPTTLSAIRELHSWAMDRGASFYWGEGKVHPSMTAWISVDETASPCWTVYLYEDDGSLLGLNFDWLRTRTSTARLDVLANDLRMLPEAADALSDLEEREYRRRPGLKIAAVAARDDAIDTIFHAYDRLIDR